MANNGGITSASHIPIAISTIIVMLTIVGGFWSLADPRNDLKSIRENYLSLREHEEFVRRFDRDVTRLEDRTIALDREKADKEMVIGVTKNAVSQAEFNSFRDEREKRLGNLEQRIKDLEAELHRHVNGDADRFMQRGESRSK